MSEAPRKLVILGSTGSIGKQTLEVVDRHPDRFKVVGLAARDEIDELALQAEKYHPSMVAIGETGCYQPLKNRIGEPARWWREWRACANWPTGTT